MIFQWYWNTTQKSGNVQTKNISLVFWNMLDTQDLFDPWGQWCWCTTAQLHSAGQGTGLHCCLFWSWWPSSHGGLLDWDWVCICLGIARQGNPPSPSAKEKSSFYVCRKWFEGDPVCSMLSWLWDGYSTHLAHGPVQFYELPSLRCRPGRTILASTSITGCLAPSCGDTFDLDIFWIWTWNQKLLASPKLKSKQHATYLYTK